MKITLKKSLMALVPWALLLFLTVPLHAEEAFPLTPPEPQLGFAPEWSDRLKLDLPPEESSYRPRSALFPRIGDFALPHLTDRHLSKAFYNIVYNASRGVADGWTGSIANCNQGTTSSDFKDSVAIRVNYYRAMAGIPDAITFYNTYSAKSQQAALMMSAADQLSHTPGTNWPCYTADGREAAENSNLSLGNYGADAVMSQMRDNGSNNAAVGHRRWILYPQTEIMGSGDVPASGNYSRANSLWVFDSNTWAPRPDVRNSDDSVSWPPPGYVPYNVVYPRWSFSYPGADFSNAAITVVRNDQYLVPVGHIYTGGVAYGENSIIWVPEELNPNDQLTSWPKPQNDTKYTIIIQDVKIGNSTQDFVYDVIIFDPSTVGAGEVSPTISGNSSPYNHTKISFNAGDYQMRELTFQPNQGLEGAEPGTTGSILDNTHDNYSLIQSGRKRSGSYGFQLAHPEPIDQAFTIDRDFYLTSDSQLRFYWTKGWATERQHAKAYVSLDDGGSWIELFSNNTASSSPPAFALETRSLANYSGRIARFKFSYEHHGGLYYYQTDSDVGFFVDDIEVTNADELLTASIPSSIGTSGNFTYTPSGTGTFGLQVRALPWSGFGGLEWGLVKEVTASCIASGANLEVTQQRIDQCASAGIHRFNGTPGLYTSSTITIPSGQSKEFTSTATSSVRLNPGFHFKAEGSATFRAWIE